MSGHPHTNKMYTLWTLSHQKKTMIFMALWTLLIGLSLLWNLDNIQQQNMEQAYASARANLNKDITLRRWATSHGGVYVPITETQESVPWLSHIPGRDVVTTEGKKLTLLNPASMLRQMMDAYATEYGVRGRITGLRYLNPANKPDEWEKIQLEAFDKGTAKEIWSVANIDGKPYLRHLRAMYMEPGCDKCHAILGYKDGDMRGATGLNLPLESYYARIDKAQFQMTLSHTFIWALGVLGLSWGSRISRQRQFERGKREEERAEAAEILRIYANAFDSSGEAMLLSDNNNHIFNVNPAFTKLTGYTLEEVTGKNPRIFASDRTPAITYQEMWANLKEDGFWQGELWDRTKSGEIYPKWVAISTIRDQANEVFYYIASFTDISERKAAEARIEHLAHHDILTGLYNRFSLEERLDQSLLNAKREQQQLAILVIDLDKFKDVNDSLGHHIGDKLLIEVAQRLMMCVRESDITARIGGDEFVVVLPAIATPHDAAEISQKVLQEISMPYHIEGNEIRSTPSIGVSIYPGDGENSELLMKNADLAMYHAKSSGRNNYQFFSGEMLIAIQERLRLENELSIALDKGQFELYYQPQIRLSNKSISGVEALVRWKHPVRGMVPPDCFIPAAEASGLIQQLGSWVIDEACRQLAAWKHEKINHIRMAVNLSTMQLQSKELVYLVQTAMLRHGIIEGELELEITETSAMQDPELAVSQLNAIRQLGVMLAIDDFGTGYSSLAYIKRLPVQILKLDQTFVKDIGFDENDTAISAATIALAHNLGLKVVAEGVETELQRDFLQAHHCDFFQGYLFSKPVPAAEAIKLIVENHSNKS
jgi:diguanylate cyclase (GGDEF)-like protein/PAS domain S-box-containing protein